jgi:hypothetical protein
VLNSSSPAVYKDRLIDVAAIQPWSHNEMHHLVFVSARKQRQVTGNGSFISVTNTSAVSTGREMCIRREEVAKIN